MGGCDFTAAIVAEGWKICRDELPATEEQPQVSNDKYYLHLRGHRRSSIFILIPDLSCIFVLITVLIPFIPALLVRD